MAERIAVVVDMSGSVSGAVDLFVSGMESERVLLPLHNGGTSVEAINE